MNVAVENTRAIWVQLLKPPHSSCVMSSKLPGILRCRQVEDAARGDLLLEAIERFRAAIR